MGLHAEGFDGGPTVGVGQSAEVLGHALAPGRQSFELLLRGAPGGLLGEHLLAFGPEPLSFLGQGR